ncbi:MAG: L-threonylcarbamoyladenylate synthase [Candidatus Eisenbacteria bacterium]|nr:L-threonylcarbamoyladenylate synthase [Candidatus Eisenbacteria bacterium]
MTRAQTPQTRVIKADPEAPEAEAIERAVSVLRTGGVLALPTDTLYGLSASLSMTDAIRRIIALKKRDAKKPFILLVGERDWVSRYVKAVTPEAEALMKGFWPGPLSLILSPQDDLPSEVRERDGIALRQPSSKLCLSILELLGEGMVSTSANVSGSTPPRTCKEVLRNFETGIDLVIDGGISPQALASTVVDVRISPPSIIREGAIPAQRITALLKQSRHSA